MNIHERPLLTISEIALRWQVNPVSVRRALDSKRFALVGYKSPDAVRGTWLIATASVIARWGQPRT